MIEMKYSTKEQNFMNLKIALGDVYAPQNYEVSAGAKNVSRIGKTHATVLYHDNPRNQNSLTAKVTKDE